MHKINNRIHQENNKMLKDIIDDNKTIIKNHYQNHLGTMHDDVIYYTEGNTQIGIYQFPPTWQAQHWTLITNGLSEIKQSVPDDYINVSGRVEIMMYADKPGDWMFELLKRISFSIINGEVIHWLSSYFDCQKMEKDYEACSLLFLPPYFEGRRFDSLHIQGERVDILWMAPISIDEYKFATKNENINPIVEKILPKLPRSFTLLLNEEKPVTGSTL